MESLTMFVGDWVRCVAVDKNSRQVMVLRVDDRPTSNADKVLASNRRLGITSDDGGRTRARVFDHSQPIFHGFYCRR